MPDAQAPAFRPYAFENEMNSHSQTRQTSSSSKDSLPGQSPAAGRLDVVSCGIGSLAKLLPDASCAASYKASCEASEGLSEGTAPAGQSALAEAAKKALFTAEHIYAAPTLAKQLPSSIREGSRLHSILPSPQKALKEALQLVRDGARVCLLASGDALCQGIGGTLARLLQTVPDKDSLPICFHPGITAFQVLCSRLAMPWEKARLFSAHSGKTALRPMLESPFALIYTGIPLTAAELAKRLCALHPASRNRSCIIAEQLGTEKERIEECVLADAVKSRAHPTSILALLPKGAVPMPLPLGMEDAAYDFAGHCLTARQIRPVVLSLLRLPSFGELWDLGAGSGSVGIEAALLRPNLHVSAVECVPERCRNIEENCRRHAVANYTLHQKDSLSAISSLPAPNRVFIGGGVSRELLQRALDALAPDDPDACVVVSAITLETLALLQCADCGICTETISLDIAVRSPIGSYTRLSPLNRIHLFVFAPKRAAQGSRLQDADDEADD